MINAAALLRDLKGQKGLAALLEADIRERIQDQPGLEDSLAAEWQAAKDASRTAQTLHDFKEEAITQAAVHWLLMGVFVRFLEDNGLLDKPYLSAADPERRALALDRHETYFLARPGDSDREYLLACFHDVASLPGMAALFDERHNPLWRLQVSGDGAMALLGFWQKIDPDTGKLVRDFTDPDWDTRFLGDLYQDLSEAAQKRYALLQTPEFVEEFILDRTLEPALREFGYREVRLIDPTCGSGHFLLGAFRRLLDQWQRNEPARNRRDTVQKALDGVYGVDLNPFAVAIARFRLLIAALAASDERHLAEAPNFHFNLGIGDSLLHGPQKQADLFMDSEHFAGTSLAHAYAVEDLDELNRILGQSYHAVVGNPPYITVKDAALNQTYRKRYTSCHRQYSLGVPFTERFFELAKNPSPPAPLPKGRGEEDNASLSPSPLGERGWGEGAGKVFKTRTTAELSPILTEFAREMRHAPTDAEGRLWYFLRNRRMAGHKFRRQHQIGHYIVDFVCVDAQLAIEIDGGQHAEPEGHQKDQTRDQFLRGRGLEVLRFWNHEVLANTDAVLEKIWSALQTFQPSSQPLSLKNPSPPAPLPKGRGEEEPSPLSPSPLGERGWGEGAGYVGMITANSFMKREFGKKLIEQFFPRIDLTHVIDTAGAYIPGHGTPTVILLGRNRPPVISSIRTVMGIKGEPSTPANPAQGLVWSAILKQVDSAGSESAFVSVADTPRTTFCKHPWSIGGGGAADLLENLSSPKTKQLESLTTAIGRITHTGADEVYFSDKRTWQRKFGDTAKYYPLVEGDRIRDWNLEPETWILFPYNQELQAYLDETGLMAKYLWIYKQFLVRRREPGGTHEEVGLTWYEWSRFQRERFRVPLGITFAEVATHNHFVLDRGGKVFKQTAPVIKLPAGATEDEHLALLGLLNSSVACFWLKQVCHNKGSTVDQHGARQRTSPFEDFYAFNATKLAEFPIPPSPPAPLPEGRGEEDDAAILSPSPFRERGWGEGEIARRLDQLARQRAECLPTNLFK